MLTRPFPLPVIVTAVIQLLLWRDRRKAARAESEGSLPEFQDSDIQTSDVDEKKVAGTAEVKLVSLD